MMAPNIRYTNADLKIPLYDLIPLYDKNNTLKIRIHNPKNTRVMHP